MICTHCEKEIETYKKSAPQPRKNWHYILCSCGNVMSALFKNNAIIAIQNTPSDDSEETLKEMYLAKKLFDDAGFQVYSYSVDNSSQPEAFKDEMEIDTNVVYPDFGVDKKRSLFAKFWDFCKTAF